MTSIPRCCVLAVTGVLTASAAAAAPPASNDPRPASTRAVQQIDRLALADAAHTDFVPRLSCKGICVSGGCLPEFKNTSKAVIAEGSAFAFTVIPDPKALEYDLSLPKALGPGEAWRPFAVFSRIDSCKAHMK
jgi:hypothetical protein